jgi:hypothetical protein
MNNEEKQKVINLVINSFIAGTFTGVIFTYFYMLFIK